jgi:C-terminal processing protease CtpA/Prc
VINDRVYVCYDTKELPAETELISVENEPVSKIIENLLSYMPSDGKIKTGKLWEMNNGDNSFPVMYYLVYGEKSAFTVKYKKGTGEQGTTVLQADYLKNAGCDYEQRQIESHLNLTFKQTTAILTIRTFSDDLIKKTNENFNTFLDTSFKEINNRKIQSLIIDLRNNSGGHDVNGAMLYSYLTDKSFNYYSSLETAKGKLKIEDHPNLSLLNHNKNNFKGKVYFLINGKSFSATAEFCAIAKSNDRGKFIGEETGGGYYGNTSGERTILILPNTKIRINIPLVKYVMAVKEAEYKDRGIIPDYIITPDIASIINGKDVQLDEALKIAEK